MPVVAIKTELRCKICASGHRAEIDELLVMRAKQAKNADGDRVNSEFILKLLPELGIANPTLDNIKRHWSKHCEYVDDSAAASSSDVQERIIAKGAGSVDDVLDRITEIGMADLEAKVKVFEAGGKIVGVTVDHLLKAQQLKSQRSQNDAALDLMSSVGAGIASALANAPVQRQLPEAHLELPAEDVAEAELVA